MEDFFGGRCEAQQLCLQGPQEAFVMSQVITKSCKKHVREHLCEICRYNSPLSSQPVPLSYRVYCLLGDGEMSEGAVWEAMSFASYYQLDNLVAIMDINRLGQSDPAPLQHHVEKYQKRCEAFG